jgi:hypothetical protein
MELSLVSRGASDNPKILSRAKQLVSKDEHDRMAASGTPLEALVLFTSMATETPEMPKTPKELAAEAADALLAATEAEGAKDKTSEFDAAIAFAELQASIPQMIADAVAAAAPAAVEAELEAEPTVESLQAELATAQSRITDLEAAAAEETAEEAEPTDADIEVPTGGVAASAITDAKTLTASLGRANSFKTKR